MADAQTLRMACKNGSLAVNFWGDKITISEVVEILSEACSRQRHIAVRRNAPKLLERMAADAWVLAAGPHKGGFGGKNRNADQNLHITLFVASEGYHLRLDKRRHLMEITGPGMKVYDPAAAPGTDAGGYYQNQ